MTNLKMIFTISINQLFPVCVSIVSTKIWVCKIFEMTFLNMRDKNVCGLIKQSSTKSAVAKIFLLIGKDLHTADVVVQTAIIIHRDHSFVLRERRSGVGIAENKKIVKKFWKSICNYSAPAFREQGQFFWPMPKFLSNCTCSLRISFFKKYFIFAVVFLSLFQLDCRFKCWGHRWPQAKHLNWTQLNRNKFTNWNNNYTLYIIDIGNTICKFVRSEGYANQLKNLFLLLTQ